mgnify:CR=1 FL=1
MGVVDLRVAHETAGGAREADARRGRVGWGGTARRAALHMRESTHPTAMYVRSLALAALALAGSLVVGARGYSRVITQQQNMGGVITE